MESEAIAERLQRQIAFLVECDRLKEIFRQTLNSQSRRRENDAEHSWALCLFAATLAEHSNEPIDVLRVLKMLQIHDLVEIDAGDTFAYDAAAMVGQHEREARAAERIFGLLPDDQAAEFRALWDEFEAKESAESKFANALDRMQSMLLNCVTEGASWRKHGVTREMIMARNAHIVEGSAPLWRYMVEQVERAVAAGHIAP
jgi:putative hydrolase of HD superfamily